jgi:hypothetical protein
MVEKLPIWHADNDYRKIVGQTRMALGAIWIPLVGQQYQKEIDRALTETMKIVEDSWVRIRGGQKPISLEYVRRSK